MTALDRLLERGLPATLSAVRAARARVRGVVRANPRATPGEVIALARRELLRAVPDLAKALTGGILAAWVAAARGPARDAIPAPAGPAAGQDADPVPLVPPPPPPAPWFDVPRWPSAGLADPPVRFPAVEAGVADLLSRKAVTTAHAERLAADARAAAFEVARVLTDDAAGAVRDAVTRHVASGGTLRQFRAEVGDVLTSAGMGEGHVEAVYRTQTGLARSAGLRAVLDHELIADEFPYVAWHATRDGRVRPDHLAMETAGLDGTNVYRADDPAVRAVWPPAGWNCRCVLTPLDVESAAAAGVKEARRWLATGEPPPRPAFVAGVPLRLPRNWPAPSARITPAVW